MDSTTHAFLDQIAGDLREAIEEAWATRLLLIAFAQWIADKGSLTASDMPTIIENSIRMVVPHQSSSEDEERLLERMRGRLSALEPLLSAPAGSRPRIQ